MTATILSLILLLVVVIFPWTRLAIPWTPLTTLGMLGNTPPPPCRRTQLGVLFLACITSALPTKFLLRELTEVTAFLTPNREVTLRSPASKPALTTNHVNLYKDSKP